MDKVKTTVIIGGKEYTIAGIESAEYIHRVALCVNHKMDEIKRGNEQLNNTLLAVLTAINIADDYIKTKDELAELKKQVETYKKEREALKPQVSVSKFR